MQPATRPRPTLSRIWSDELAREAPRLAWLWPGYLARGNLTLLTSQWKSGKTTLLSVLLARRRDGGLLLGRAVAAGKTAVVSEEPREHWQRRHALLDFGDRVCFLCRPFPGQPRPEDWRVLLDELAGLHAEHGIDLAVIDPLASFLPGHAESNPALLLEALLPLQQLSGQGLAVLVLHHPRKGPALEGQAARGSGALPGCVDSLIEMSLVSAGAPTDRRRRLRAWSRHPETPLDAVIELNAAGTDYGDLGDLVADELAREWGTLRSVLQEALRKLTRQQIMEQWPPDHAKPAKTTLWRWLEEAVQRGLACRDGRGTRLEPFRYWLAEKLAEWAADPLYFEDQPEMDWLRETVQKARQQAAPGADEEEAPPKKRPRRRPSQS